MKTIDMAYSTLLLTLLGVFDGVGRFLIRVKPVGWVEELNKLENMTGATYMTHLIGAESWQVKMRMINRDTVLPRQVGQEIDSIC